MESRLHAGQDPESQSHRGKVGTISEELLAQKAGGERRRPPAPRGFGGSLAQVLPIPPLQGQEEAAGFLGEGGAQ